MDKEQREFELKKIEIEKSKILEGILRSLIISLLTIGAGEGTLIFKLLTTTNEIAIATYKTLLIVLTIILILLSIVTAKLTFTLKMKLED